MIALYFRKRISKNSFTRYLTYGLSFLSSGYQGIETKLIKVGELLCVDRKLTGLSKCEAAQGNGLEALIYKALIVLYLERMLLS